MKRTRLLPPCPAARAAVCGVLLCVVAVLASCGSDDDGSAAPGDERALRVVTTTTQLTDFAENVGGDSVVVHAVLKANTDPHDYEPTPADLEAMADAEVIIKNGVGLEQWFEDTIRSADPTALIVDASTSVELRDGGEADHDGGEHRGDPHIWLDPDNAKVMVRTIAEAFDAAAPAMAPAFEENARAYTMKIDEMDRTVTAQLAGLDNRKIVTNHDAFGYFTDHFGLQFVGSIIPSFDTQAELSPGDITQLVAKIRAEGVKAVFSESSLPPKTAQAIGSEAGVKVVAGPDSLYADTLGPPGSPGDTYLTMMQHNADVILENLS